MINTPTHVRRSGSLLLVAGLLFAACGSDAADGTADVSSAPGEDVVAGETVVDSADASTDSAEAPAGVEDVIEEAGESSVFQIEVWADNWMAVYVNGELIGEDSVSITTERSFNAEVFTFEAMYPFTVAIEAKDFMETDSGIEYIGEGNQQMGDGGLIAQITDTATGDIVAATNASWTALVVHRAPLNTECERDADPDATCEFEITEVPDGWASDAFDDSAWAPATEWAAADVGPKDGYDEISWDGSAALVWGTDLEVDNTVLLRTTVPG